MCEVCEARKNNRVNELVNLTYLYCSYCPLLTSIPDTLVNLTELFCYHCPLLTSIPSALVNLTYLNCSHCPLLTSIPDTLVNLTRLDCSYCPLLTSVPIATAYCPGCYWLPRNDPMPPSRSARVTVIQRWARRSRKGRLLSRWMKSRGFNEWFYAPSGIGGRQHVRRLGQFVEDL